MSCSSWEASLDAGSHNRAGCLALHSRIPMRVPRADGDEETIEVDAAEALAHLDDDAHPWTSVDAETLMRRLLFANVCEGGIIEGDRSGELARAFALVGLDHDLEAFGAFPSRGSYPEQPRATLAALRLIRSTRNREDARFIKRQTKTPGGDA